MKIAFLFGPLLHAKRELRWDELWTDERGLTGSEVACVALAQEMAARGHAVTFYAPQEAQGEYRLPVASGGVVGTARLDEFSRHAAEHGAVYAWCEPDLLRSADPRSVRLCNQQLNDFQYCQPGFDAAVDVWTSPSRTHLEFLQTRRELPALGGTVRSKWVVLPNGCYPGEYDWAGPKEEGLCVYASSPDRGLHLVLQEWPRIRREVPGARLRIFYFALKRWLEGARKIERDHPDPAIQEHRRRAAYVEMALARASRLGIEVVGGVSRAQLARELSAARVMTYPCDTIAWSEGFSCATLEGCASGALPVIAGCDALGEIYGEFVPWVSPPAHAHMDEWRALVLRALTDEPWRAEQAAEARKLADLHAWPKLAERLEAVVEGKRAEKVSAPAGPGTRSAVEPSGEREVSLHLTLTPAAALPARVLSVEDPDADDAGGGARAGFLGLVRAMAARPGYRVRAYCPVRAPLVHAGAEWQPFDRYRADGARPDVLLSYFDFSTLTGREGMLRIASHHSCAPYPGAPYDWADLNVAPSRWAVDFLRRMAPEERWAVLPNALAPLKVERRPVRGQVLYHASPSRGLHLLLEVWPEVRRRVPYATLRVVGPMDEWVRGHYGQAALRTSAQGRRIARIRAALPKAMEAGGVEVLGSLTRARLLGELSAAACFSYPCSMCYPSETFSISVLECCAAGVPVLLAPQDALKDLWENYTRCVPELPPNAGPEHMKDFLQELYLLLEDDEEAAYVTECGKRAAEKYTFEKAAEVLDGLIRENLR